MRYFFHIGYCGADYRGWQRQPQSISVQETIEQALRKVFARHIACIGCGRTDSLVNAQQYFFHSDIPEGWNFDLVFRLNKILPDDIAIFDIHPVSLKAHAQFSATHRTYHYYIHTQKNPFLSRVSALYLENHLDLERAGKACMLLTRYTDYAAFCKSPKKHNHTTCKVYNVRLSTNITQTRIRFSIRADRFLRSMIRILVMRILFVAQKRLSIPEFENLFCSPCEGQFSTIAYPQGLHLAKVEYPFLTVPAQSSVSEVEWIDVCHVKRGHENV
ncbi:tRNA pseudouridine synthase A [Candidatus Uabimicrobium amorphum]|uniref:tRNA pseudouridine synthase A n=1 Tax=Uabimicrobium amorphum TaxID=2596890 RepID=A0A5S9F2Y1_UABAM|nr:tRNA pseudouridine synthase A [Candidatus Uabimicrobium amorphum]BBM83918.1 tRNA pseudouridine synthase A [Candidatus Uabimicrobium amorphum]